MVGLLLLLLFIYLFFFIESPLEFVTPLRDRLECTEGDKVMLVCELNKPNKPAMWLRDGEQITAADGYEIIVDGNVHKLVIRRASLDDEAEYTVMVGNNESSTMVFVEGEKFKF